MKFMKCSMFRPSALSSTLIRRNLHREIRIKMKEKNSPTKLALEYFDFYYASSFGDEWPGIRLALLTGQKYVALVNNYSTNSTETVINLHQKQTAIDMFQYLSKQQQQIELDSKPKIPKSLRVFCFDNADVTNFEPPRVDHNILLNYYCMDGASLLPVLALDLDPKDSVLDLCASPGGKSLVMLQTMLPKKIECRDVTQKRMDRLNRMLRSYLPVEELTRLVNFEYNLGYSANQPQFDKILVDVPCTNDRNSLFNNENNIFTRARNEERSQIQKKQIELLTQAVRSCKPNGTIVYSTCSLSPIQNEGVVNAVLNMFDHQAQFKLHVEPLECMKHYFSYFYNFSNSCKSGLLVAPNINKNFGPFYLCKILKLPK